MTLLRRRSLILARWITCLLLPLGMAGASTTSGKASFQGFTYVRSLGGIDEFTLDWVSDKVDAFFDHICG